MNPEKNTRGRLRNLFEHGDLTRGSTPFSPVSSPSEGLDRRSP